MKELKDSLIRIEDKLEKLAEQNAEQNVILGKQSVILDEHVKRTNILESTIKPIQHHVSMVQGAFKFIGLLATAFAIAAAIKSFYG